jgi:hypothetical protein
VTTKSDLDVGQTTLYMSSSEGPNVVNDEAVVSNGSLEALQAIPWKKNEINVKLVNRLSNIQVMLKTRQMAKMSGLDNSLQLCLLLDNDTGSRSLSETV